MLNKTNAKLFNEIIALAQSGGIDAATAVRKLAEINEKTQRLKERIERGGAGQRIYTVPFVGVVTVANTGITPIQKTIITWPTKALILGMKANIAEGAAPSHVTLSLRDERQRSFFSNGNTDAFVDLETFQGNHDDQGGWYPFLEGIMVEANTQWYAEASSADSLPASGSTNYTPLVKFLVDEDV